MKTDNHVLNGCPNWDSYHQSSEFNPDALPLSYTGTQADAKNTKVIRAKHLDSGYREKTTTSQIFRPRNLSSCRVVGDFSPVRIKNCIKYQTERHL